MLYNNRDEQGNYEDPITYDPLDMKRYLVLASTGYTPESLAAWMIEHDELIDLYGNELTERQTLDLLHFLDGREDAPRYPRYGKLVLLVARTFAIPLTYLIYRKNDSEQPEFLTFYASLRAADEQLHRLTKSDGKERMIGVHPVTDDTRFTAPLHCFVRVKQ